MICRNAPSSPDPLPASPPALPRGARAGRLRGGEGRGGPGPPCTERGSHASGSGRHRQGSPSGARFLWRFPVAPASLLPNSLAAASLSKAGGSRPGPPPPGHPLPAGSACPSPAKPCGGETEAFPPASQGERKAEGHHRLASVFQNTQQGRTI